MDNKFRDYLEGVFARIFYNMGKATFEEAKMSLPKKEVEVGEEEMLSSLNAISEKYAKEMVHELEKKGISSSKDLASMKGEISTLIKGFSENMITELEDSGKS